MSRDDRQLALSELLAHCEATVRRYRHAADILAGKDGEAVLRRFAIERESLTQRLRYQVRQLGGLPDTVDAECDTFQILDERVMARLAARGASALLRSRIDDEQRVMALTNAALTGLLPESVRHILEAAREDVRRTIDLLAQESDRAAQRN
ncbi:hypothetical protein [Nitrococcus mobilis]|uniref:DUF2383 domain-containing protein n=1 Tax=Nitrococcus mobilis Nb-231 TaxID=314278 RepID=A4BSG9_9GAMM|nr:hypothetical protein [Nitrococcus mobilis]EAR21429.1 hypothetical protein NB231_13581 [Nitrococcus mobilis Nb-231]